MNSQKLAEQLNWRYAVKQFDASKKIPQEIWSVLEESLILAPSSYGLQPWKFLVVNSPELRKKLRAVSWGQSQVEEASHYVVFCVRDQIVERDINRWVSRLAEVRGVGEDKLAPYQKMMHENILGTGRGQQAFEWNARQAYIALGTLMTSAAMLNVDSCPLEGLDPVKYDEILGLSDGANRLNGTYKTVCACAMGYRASTDKSQHGKKARFLKSEIIQTL